MSQKNHLLVDAGATKSAFVLLGGDEPFRCQCAGINANYTPEADIPVAPPRRTRCAWRVTFVFTSRPPTSVSGPT